MTPDFVAVANGDTTINVAVHGTGPLLVFVHGWPELWYSWRHQMQYFGDRGYKVAALDVRGYGGSSNPADIESYTLRHLTSDVAAVIDALDDEPAIVVGHDWGAPIAWNTARLHADKVRAVAGLSVPYMPVSTDNPLDLWRERYTNNDTFFYQVYFDDNRGGAEAELSADHARSLRMIYYMASGDRPEELRGLIADKPAKSLMLDGLVDPDPFPAWCTAEDIAVYAAAFEHSGWHGPLNRYRAQPLDASEIGPLPDPEINQPAAFIGGERDPVRGFAPGLDLYDFAGVACRDFRGTTVIDGAGHWVQQEAPQATNAALEAFFTSI